MHDDRIYTCETVCGQKQPCGNRHCSANPKYVHPSAKPAKPDDKKSRTDEP